MKITEAQLRSIIRKELDEAKPANAASRDQAKKSIRSLELELATVASYLFGMSGHGRMIALDNVQKIRKAITTIKVQMG